MGQNNDPDGLKKICQTAQVLHSVQVWYTTPVNISGLLLLTQIATAAQFRTAIKEKVGYGTHSEITARQPHREDFTSISCCLNGAYSHLYRTTSI